VEIVRKFLGDTTPPNTRYNDETDTVQVTVDGGATWIDVPELDPRNPIYQLPADPTDNPQCDAAERAINQLADEINVFLNTTSALQVVNTLLDALLLLLPGFGLIAGVIWVVVEALLAIGSSVIAAAFTSDVYDGLKCLWYDRVGSDGIMTESAMLDWQDAVSAAYPGTVASVVSLFVDNFGLVQLNNAAVKRTETGDCSSCTTCVNYADDFTGGLGSQTTIGVVPGSSGWNISGGTWTSLYGHNALGQIISSYDGTQYVASCYVDLGDSCTVTALSMWTAVTNGGYVHNIVCFDEDGALVWQLGNSGSSANAWYHTSISGQTIADVRYVLFYVTTGSSTQSSLDDIAIDVL